MLRTWDPRKYAMVRYLDFLLFLLYSRFVAKEDEKLETPMDKRAHEKSMLFSLHRGKAKLNKTEKIL